MEVWIQDWTPNLGTFCLSFHGHAKVCYILGLKNMGYTNDRLHSSNFISSPKLTMGFRVCLRSLTIFLHATLMENNFHLSDKLDCKCKRLQFVCCSFVRVDNDSWIRIHLHVVLSESI